MLPSVQRSSSFFTRRFFTIKNFVRWSLKKFSVIRVQWRIVVIGHVIPVEFGKRTPLFFTLSTFFIIVWKCRIVRKRNEMPFGFFGLTSRRRSSIIVVWTNFVLIGRSVIVCTAKCRSAFTVYSVNENNRCPKKIFSFGSTKNFLVEKTALFGSFRIAKQKNVSICSNKFKSSAKPTSKVTAVVSIGFRCIFARRWVNVNAITRRTSNFISVSNRTRVAITSPKSSTKLFTTKWFRSFSVRRDKITKDLRRKRVFFTSKILIQIRKCWVELSMKSIKIERFSANFIDGEKISKWSSILNRSNKFECANFVGVWRNYESVNRFITKICTAFIQINVIE